MSKRKPRGYWNKENCRKEALKYNNTTDFINSTVSAYNVIIKNGWKGELCSHFIKRKRKLPAINQYWTKERCKLVANKYYSISEFAESNINVYNIIIKRG